MVFDEWFCRLIGFFYYLNTQSEEIPTVVVTLFYFVLAVIATRVIEILTDEKVEDLLFSFTIGWDKKVSLDGIWLGTYYYKSSDSKSQTKAQHFIVFKRKGRKLYGDSNGVHEESRIILKLKIDENNILSGTWKEETSQKKIYYGVIQLAIEPGGKKLKGVWVGFNKRGEIKSSVWEFEQLNEKTDKVTQKLYLSKVASIVRRP